MLEWENGRREGGKGFWKEDFTGSESMMVNFGDREKIFERILERMNDFQRESKLSLI